MEIHEKERIFDITINDAERMHLIQLLRKQNIDNTGFVQDFIKLLEKLNYNKEN